jgi:hypothetical protein
MREKGFAVESVCAVLREQGCQIAARTYRAWRAGRPAAARTHADAVVIHALRATAGQPESLYGRRKMTAHLRRHGHQVAHCTVDRLMRELGMNGVLRRKSVRTTVPGKDGSRAGDLLDRDFTAPAPDRVWIADFTYVRTWTGFVYVAFVVDVYAQTIVGWHAMASKHTELVLTALRMATWRRGHQGHPVGAGLIHHSDAGSQYNKPFGRWGEVFGDEVVAAAMIDRLVHHAEVISLKGDSYRPKDRDLGRSAAATEDA